MKSLYKMALIILISKINVFAQLSAPIVEDVYGGRINAIAGYSKTADTSRIFISTESANSVFYTDVFANSSSPAFGRFHVMPGLDANANYGSNIKLIAAHAASGNLFFAKENQIFSSNAASSVVSVAYSASGLIESILIIDNYLFFNESNNFHFGTLDSGGNFTEDSNSPIGFTSSGGQKVVFKNPLSNQLYIFTEGTVPELLKFSDAYSSLSSTTTTSSISLSSLSSSVNWKGVGIAPDGRLFVISDDKYVAYSDDEISWTQFSALIGGVANKTIAFSGDSTNYRVYSASMYSASKGESGTWLSFGDPGGMETHPNDGDVFVDPLNENIIYLTTDQGIGASIDQGATIFEIDDGIEAVQVNDFSMIADKSSAWLAAKSGLRKVINYLTFPVWTNAIFPNNDGSPYYSIEMSKDDTNRVYAGNVRIYRSSDNGNNWSQIFTPENSPYNFPSVGTMANAIEECKFSPNIVMAGFEIQNTNKGGLFVSEDYGNNWEQIYLETSTDGEDVDIADIVFNLEGSDTVAYVGAIYDLSVPQGRSIYRVVKNGSNWLASQDMDATGTAVGYPITATIQDLEITASSDTIYATGTDAGINHPITYYKIVSGTNLWTTMTTTGYPFSSGKQATAVTIGVDTIYVAVDNEIYYFPLGGTQWQLGYSYPVGTRINFLYFDELLAGTSFGLYGHIGIKNPTAIESETEYIPDNYSLEQNFPNPFNPTTTIRFSIPNSEFVSLKIYNVLGKEVANLINENRSAGSYKIYFDGSHLASGVYFYRLRAGKFELTKKLLLIK